MEDSYIRYHKKKSSFGLRAILLFLVVVAAAIFVWEGHATIRLEQDFFVQKRGPIFIDVIGGSGIDKDTSVAGAAWADYNTDGYLDLLFAGGRAGVKLYQNNRDGTFTDVTDSSGLQSRLAAQSAGVFGDYDNDGCPDLYISRSIARDNQGRRIEGSVLYHNNCDGTFADVTAQAGIEEGEWSERGVAWADYDNDGYLDLYVAVFDEAVPPGRDPMMYVGKSDILYHNNGNGTFTNVTKYAEILDVARCDIPERNEKTVHRKITGPYKPALQVAWFDVNNDGRPDLFVAIDGATTSLFYINNGDGTFTETTRKAGLCRIASAMGIAVGDYDNDGDSDFYVTNTGANFLWRNHGDGTFTDVAAEAHVADATNLGWGAGFFDYDNDGDLDLHVVNGDVEFDPATSKNDSEKIGSIRFDKLYRNNGDGIFSEVSAQEGISVNDPKAGAAFGDYNNDGFIDVVVLTSNYLESKLGHHLYKNQGNTNHWLTVQLIGTKSNRDSIGARIVLTAGGKTQMREIISGSSFLSQDSLWQTLGLGSAQYADTIEIRWPSGITKTLRTIRADQKIVIEEE